MNNKLKKMVGIALLATLVVVLQFLGGLIPPVSGFSISLVLIPIVMGAAIYGPGAAALLGGIFGVIVTVNCVNGTDFGGAMVFQANPALCILVVMAKGILAGFAAGWAYRLLKDKNPYLAMVCAAVVCPVVNTGFFIGCMLAFFRPILSAWAGGSDLITYILAVLILANFVPELIINVVFCPVGQRVLETVRK